MTETNSPSPPPAEEPEGGSPEVSAARAARIGDSSAAAPRTTVRLRSVALWVVIAAGSLFLIRELAALLQPLVLAVFLCYIFLPLHQWLVRHRIPSVLSYVLIVGGVVLSFYLLGLLVYNNVAKFEERWPAYEKRGHELVQEIDATIQQYAPDFRLADVFTKSTDKESAGQEIRQVLGSVVELVVEFVAFTALIGFYLIFLLSEANRFPKRIKAALPPERAEHFLAVTGQINQGVFGYLFVKIKASALTALPVTLVLWLFGVDFVLLWGVLTFLANFIPYIGSLLVCLMPILLSFLQFDTITTPILFGLVLIAVHQTMGNVVEPLMTGGSVGLSPLVILIALAFWGAYWGVIGMFLSVPIAVAIKVILENTPGTQPLARMMADK